MPRERDCDYLPPEGMSRRRLLGLGVKTGLGVAIAGPVLFGKRSSIENTSLNISVVPEAIRDDILTAEELEKAHIKIYPTPDVKLYLRRSALEIPIFKDAKDGKINGVVISLVDHDRISWNAIDRLPPDPKSVLQKLRREKNPKNWPESYWQDLKKRTQSALNSHQQSKKIFTEDLAMVISGEREKKVRDNVILYRKLVAQDGTDVKELTKSLKYLESELEDIFNGTRVTQLQQSIAREERLIKEADNARVILHGPRNRAIEYFAEYGVSEPNGLMVMPLAEYGNKAYIYLAVKGESMPHPSQSFPSPDQFKVYPKMNGYDEVLHKETMTPGFILGHEAAHYEADEWSERERESAANRLAYELLMRAWRQYQETGSTSGYPFVFMTKEGVTITKTRDSEASAL